MAQQSPPPPGSWGNFSLSKLQNVFLKLKKYICPNCKKDLSKEQYNVVDGPIILPDRPIICSLQFRETVKYNLQNHGNIFDNV